MNQSLRKLFYAVSKPGRVAVLDYPVKPRPLYSPDTKPHQRLYEMISRNDAVYSQLVEESLEYLPAFQQFQLKATEDKTPAWENGFFPAFDSIVHYTMLTRYKPQKYIEIGSGNSTKVAYFCRRQQNFNFSITCIDPYPRREIKEIADEWIARPIQEVDIEIFKNLQPNDVVFFDGSHVLHPDSDVMWFFLEVLPAIPKGVIIHIHDIFLPYDYLQWMCDRFYSEQYIFAACLLNGSFEVLSPNYYSLTKRLGRSALEKIWQLTALQNVKKHGRSFWFTKLS